MSNKIYDIVTKAIIEKLESVDPTDFEKPWFNVGISPYNAISKKTYRGCNYITLGNNGHESKAYASYKQWKGKDCQVRKGEKAHLAVFWKLSEFEDKATGENKTVPLLRFYNVFNSEQVNGDWARELEQKALNRLKDHDPIGQGEALVNDYLQSQNLKVEHTDRAFYSHGQTSEYIGMPKLGQFKDAESYYATFLHEITHSTGHSKRLDRDMTGSFGSRKYAFEELVAELGSAMLCGQAGITNKPRPDHAQYIKSWIRALKNDNKYIIQAASKAQKAADFVLEQSKTNGGQLDLLAEAA